MYERILRDIEICKNSSTLLGSKAGEPTPSCGLVVGGFPVALPREEGRYYTQVGRLGSIWGGFICLSPFSPVRFPHSCSLSFPRCCSLPCARFLCRVIKTGPRKRCGSQAARSLRWRMWGTQSLGKPATSPLIV